MKFTVRNKLQLNIIFPCAKQILDRSFIKKKVLERKSKKKNCNSFRVFRGDSHVGFFFDNCWDFRQFVGKSDSPLGTFNSLMCDT